MTKTLFPHTSDNEDLAPSLVFEMKIYLNGLGCIGIRDRNRHRHSAKNHLPPLKVRSSRVRNACGLVIDVMFSPYVAAEVLVRMESSVLMTSAFAGFCRVSIADR